MRQSIKKKLDLVREETVFWQEFSDAGVRRFSTGEIARIIAAQEVAERKLAELERMLSRYDQSGGKLIGQTTREEP
jgi:hypothetical protein